MKICKGYPIYLSVFSIIQESKKLKLNEIDVEFDFDYYEILNHLKSKRIDSQFRKFEKIETKKIIVNIEEENECIDRTPYTWTYS